MKTLNKQKLIVMVAPDYGIAIELSALQTQCYSLT